MSSLWMPAYVAIGSNLDDPLAQVRMALQRLQALEASCLVSSSRLYRSVPLGPQEQPGFINAVAGLLTQLEPRELLLRLKRIEADMGRTSPVVRWGPRRIDLDLLVYGSVQINEGDLVVPHPGVHERNFVLYPLRDIAPDLIVPGHGSVAGLAARVGAAGLVPIP
ncbi:2-amino-4-hydroxy-6-hydroxymethyldihydropteridine diphosphokinase [Povalibacter sp.]|uniref:2-amino-4-hydroxy-6- hydroxymethyldihydropteridine diphosphokinase n=1 Tax=Povalibacter sp. TaxID=1962978 RepID=UPI002F3F4DE4